MRPPWAASAGARTAVASAAAAKKRRTLLLRLRRGVDVRRIGEPRLGTVVYGELARVQRRGAELTCLVHRVEDQLKTRLAVARQQPRLGQVGHALQRLEAGVGGLHAAAHVF